MVTKFVINVFFFLVLTIAALELGSFLINKLGVLNFNEPTYDLKMRSLFEPNFHADIDPDFGVWRPNNLTKFLKGECYEATYHSNSYGARDKERTKESENKRIFVLGSSNLEGFGVDTSFRITNLVENSLDIEMMNFSVAGFFSPTQQYLVYKKFHQAFDHDLVIMGISFPGAFKEDDIEVWRERAARTDYWKRYRPYWVGEYPNYNLVYETANLEDSSYGLYTNSKKRKKDFQKSYSWFFNMLSGPQKETTTKSIEREEGYEKANKEEIQRLSFSIENIIKLAGNKKVLVFTVPTPGSAELYKQGIKPNYIEVLNQKFNNVGPNTKFLYSESKIDVSLFQNFFLPCNRHWNENGHQVMSKVIANYVDANIK